MSEPYELTTLAIGGIAAGRMLTGHGQATAYYEFPSVAFPQEITKRDIMDVTVIHSAYYYRRKLTYITPQGREENFIFWVDTDKIKDEIDLLRELANNYRPITICGKP